MFERPQKPNFNKEMENFRKEKLSRLERVSEKGQKFFRRLNQIGVILAISMASHYEMTHNNTVKKTNENGKEIFKHSDQETSHILNYLGGVDSLSHDEKVYLFKSECQFGSKIAGHLPGNFNQMSEKEIVTFFYEYSKAFEVLKDKNKEESKYEDYEKVVSDYIDSKFPSKYEYNDTLYKTLWETEKECGSPNVRWTFGKDRRFFTSGRAAGAHYSFFTHTCFIQPYDSISQRKQLNDLISEWAHAKQFDQRYISSTLEFVKDAVRMTKDVIDSTGSYVESQKKEYEIVGSIENEAHKIIEPSIKKKFEPIKSIKLDDDKKKK